jgi:hypothetical protein
VEVVQDTLESPLAACSFGLDTTVHELPFHDSTNVSSELLV